MLIKRLLVIPILFWLMRLLKGYILAVQDRSVAFQQILVQLIMFYSANHKGCCQGENYAKLCSDPWGWALCYKFIQRSFIHAPVEHVYRYLFQLAASLISMTWTWYFFIFSQHNHATLWWHLSTLIIEIAIYIHWIISPLVSHYVIWLLATSPIIS